MSGKQFVITAKDFDPKKLKFGKVESKKEIPNAKFSRVAIGYEGMPSTHITCVPKNGAKRRDNKTCLHILLRGDLDETGKFRGLYSTGVYETHIYGTKPQNRTAETVNGYQLQVCLVKKDNVDAPTESEQQVMGLFEGLVETVKDWVVANKESLPLAFKSLSDKKLRKCVQPLHQPQTEKDGVTYGPSLFCKIGYWKANEYQGKKYPERFTTPFKGPGKDNKLNPKNLVKTHGNVIVAFRLNHLNFITGDSEEEMKIKFDSELADVNFTPTKGEEEDDICGPNQDDQGTDDVSNYEHVDHSKNYGDNVNNDYHGEEDAEADDEEEQKQKKKSKKNKKPVEQEDEE